MPIEREDLEFYFNQMSTKVDGINDRLDKLNGKTNRNVTDIAILFDRAEQAKLLAASAVLDARTTGRNHGAGWGGALGTAAGTAVILIWQWLNKGAQ